MKAQDPDLILLDEPESGVDIENMALIGEAINSLLHRGVTYAKGKSHREIIADSSKSALIITHTGHILDYITADKGQVLYNGHLCAVHEMPGKFSNGLVNSVTRSAFDARWKY